MKQHFTQFREAVAANAALILLCIFYSIAIYIFADSLGLGHRYDVFGSSAPIIFILMAGSLCIALASWAKTLRFEKPDRHLPHLLTYLKTQLRQNGGLFTYAVPLILISTLVAAFTTFKSIYPLAAPFSWDQSFSEWDRILHFGVDPWKITHALFGADIPSFAINWAYNMWFGFMWISICAALLTTSKGMVRRQYLISFCLCWILIGTIGAGLLSSAGPVYYAEVTGDVTPYGALMDKLYQSDARLNENFGLSLLALDIQEMLWQVYNSKGELFGGGISAMPSMHVSIATLMALGAWKFNRKVGIAFTIYAVIIQIGSVHLGWHYAIDGYVSVLATVGIWKATGLALSRSASSKTALVTA